MDEKKIADQVRTVVEFYNGGELIRSVSLTHELNVLVGEEISFDHPSLNQCLHGRVTKRNHVVFLAEGTPLTYIDVVVGEVMVRGTYLQMWDGVNNLTVEETATLLVQLTPATGRGVDFKGALYNDVDLVEALRYHRGEFR